VATWDNCVSARTPQFSYASITSWSPNAASLPRQVASLLRVSGSHEVSYPGTSFCLNMDIVHVSQPARYPFSTSVATIRRAATSGASWSPRTITSGFSGGSYADWIPGTVVASPCRAFW